MQQKDLLIGRSLPRTYITLYTKLTLQHAIGTLLYIVRSNRPLVSVIRRSLRREPRVPTIAIACRTVVTVTGSCHRYDWIASTFAPRTWPLTYYRLPVVYVYARDQSRVEACANERECIGVARIIARNFAKGQEISSKCASILIQYLDIYSRCTRINKTTLDVLTAAERIQDKNLLIKFMFTFSNKCVYVSSIYILYMYILLPHVLD